MQKLQIRKNIQKMLTGLADVSTWSRLVCERLMQVSQIQTAQTICCYEPMLLEPDISACSDLRATQQKTILTPLYVPGTFPQVQTMSGEIYTGEVDVFLVPGLAFTDQGARLGRGGGRYDRLLGGYNSSYKIGICFTQQIIDALPLDEWDVSMDAIITQDYELSLFS